MWSIRVRDAGSAGYPVFVGPGLLERLPIDLAGRGAVRLGPPPARVVVVADARVAALYGRDLTARIAREGLRAGLLAFPRGEASKTRETKARLEDRLAREGFGGDGLIVALGGGVTGDLAGFLAATWHRGVPLVHAPTSLIAMLDASIGGKVAVDHPLGKNLIGAFHPPRAVYADVGALATLPARELRSGIAESVKVGAIADAGLFRRLERDRAAILRRDPAALEVLVRGSARVKARIVSSDSRERGRRKLLNFGHTIGHALEAVSGYRLRHGEAVAIGIAVELRLGVELGLIASGEAGRVVRLLAAFGLPLRIPPGMATRPAEILEAARRDKKVRAGELLFAMPKRIGAHAGGSRFVVAAPEPLVRKVLREVGRQRPGRD